MPSVVHAKEQKQKYFKMHAKKEHRGEQHKFSGSIFILNQHEYQLLIVLKRYMISEGVHGVLVSLNPWFIVFYRTKVYMKT